MHCLAIALVKQERIYIGFARWIGGCAPEYLICSISGVEVKTAGAGLRHVVHYSEAGCFRPHYYPFAVGAEAYLTACGMAAQVF